MKLLKALKNKWFGLACAFVLSFACLGGGLATLNASAAENTTDIFTSPGAAFKYSDAEDGKDLTNMRVFVEVEKNAYETLKDEGKIVHILVIPTDLLGEATLTTDVTKADDYVLDAWSYEGDDTAGTYSASAILQNFPKEWYSRPFSWRAYYTDANGENEVYSAQPWERCIAEVAKEAYKTDATYKDDERIKPYFTYTASYDLGVRDAETAEWKVEGVEAVYGEPIPTPTTVPTKAGVAFYGWKYTTGGEDTTVWRDVAAEAVWLMTDSITMDSVEDLYEYADVNIPVWETEKGPNPKYLLENRLDESNAVTGINFTVKKTGTDIVTVQWKNIITASTFDVSFANTTVKYLDSDYEETTPTVNGGFVEVYVDNGWKGNFLAGTAYTGGTGYANATAYNDAFKCLTDLEIRTNNSSNSSNRISKYNVQVSFDSITVSENTIHANPLPAGTSNEGTVINAIAWSTETSAQIDMENVSDSGIRYSNSALTNQSTAAPFIFYFGEGVTLEAGDKVVVAFKRAQSGVDDENKPIYTDKTAYQGYLNGSAGTDFAWYNGTSTGSTYTVAADKACTLNCIGILLAGTNNSNNGYRDITVTACYIIKTAK